MSHSVPSDSSSADPAFLVGADLVSFDRPELPIYATPESRWAEAGHDVVAYGRSLDRLFGEPGEVFVSEAFVTPEAPAMPASMIVEDPLVVLSGLSDGLILPAPEHEPAHAHDVPHQAEIATVYDFADAHAGPDPHDLWTSYNHA